MAKLGGLAIVSSDYAMGSTMGPWIKFKGIAEIPPVRHLLLDKRFQEKHPVLNGHFEAAVREAKVYVANHSGPN